MPEGNTFTIDRTWRRTLVALTFSAGFAGLAFAQSTAPKNAREIGGCVGVVSSIGDTLTAVKTGFTVFNNEDRKLPIDAWHIDDLVFSKVSAALGKRFNLRRVSVPKGAFAVLEENHLPFYDSAEDVRAILGRITTTTKCEKYIVIMKTNIGFDTGQVIDGLGIYTRGSQYNIYAQFTINVYDGHDFALMEKHPAVSGRKNFLGGNTMPYRRVDEAWWPTADAASNPTAEQGFRDLVLQSVEATVSEAFGH